MLFHVLLNNHSTVGSGSGQEGGGQGGEPVEESLSITVTETSTPSDIVNDKYDIGDTISWNVVLRSAGSSLQTTLTCTGMPNRTVTVPGGGASVQQYSRTVDKNDINAGSIEIEISATSGNLEAEDTLELAVVDPYINIVTVISETNPLPTGELYEAGDVVAWNVAITGAGSIDVEGANVEVYCNGSLIYSNADYDIMSGATTNISGTYTILATDAGLGVLGFSVIINEPVVGDEAKPAWKTYLDITNVDTNVDISWEFIVNTKLQASTNVNTGVPIRLYGMNASTEFTVDWGDNTTTTLTPANYTNASSTAAMHTYATAGTYTVTVTAKASDWASVYLMSSSGNNTSTSNWNNKTMPMFWFRNTVQEIRNPIPSVAGIQQIGIKPSNGDEGTKNGSFDYLFYSSKLATICGGLFSLNQNAASFKGTFWNSQIGAVPNTTFYGCSTANSYDHCFYGCTKITNIDSGLFNWADGVLDFSYLFYGCTGLKTMGAGLFANSPLVTAFWSSWKRCSALQALPASLFAYTPAATNFESTFSACSKIKSIDATTFESCHGITTMQQCFENCSGLLAIPQGLLANCPNIQNFKSAFLKTKVSTLPSDLFSACTAITTIQDCFSGCSTLGSFEITFKAPNIATVSNFVPGKSGAVRTVHVKPNTTTATTLRNAASEMTLTIVEDVE